MKKGIIAALSSIIGMVLGSLGTRYVQSKQINKTLKKVDIFKGYYYILIEWLMLKQQGKSLEEYFIQNNYKTIAIYGMGDIGERLYDELKDTDINVIYAIDKNASDTYSELEVVALKDELKPVDVMIVTAISAYEEIEKEIQKVMNCPIIFLEDVMYEILKV